MGASPQIDTEGLAGRLVALPGFDRVRAAAAAAGADAYLVGGAVRDALLGRQRADLDLVVVGDHLPLARALGGRLREHDRFGTATVSLGDRVIDVVRARSESYPHPGALPEVRPSDLATDLARRDFSINAVAVPLADPSTVVDPHRGVADLRAGVLRVLHDRSLLDDPTRALRAARYTARLDLEVEPVTLAQIRAAKLHTVSADRVAVELHKLAKEAAPRRGFEILSEWGVFPLAEGTGDLIEATDRLLAGAPWSSLVSRPEAVLAALDPDAIERSRELVDAAPRSPSAAVDAARGRAGAELALARALGAEWLDRFVGEWREVDLRISGDDLLAAGVPEGERIGRGLASALRAKLDGEAPAPEDELRIALEAAGAAPERGEAAAAD